MTLVRAGDYGWSNWYDTYCEGAWCWLKNDNLHFLVWAEMTDFTDILILYIIMYCCNMFTCNGSCDGGV